MTLIRRDNIVRVLLYHMNINRESTDTCTKT